MTNVKKTKIQFAEVARHLDEQVDLFDGERTTALKQLHRIRDAKQNYMKREHGRLSIKLGPAHPRVAAFADKQIRNEQLIRDLTVEVARADSQTGEVDKDCWILHGRVYARNLIGCPGLSVSLMDRKDKLVLGPARTDKNGYFKLVYSAEKEVSGSRGKDVPIKERALYLHVSERDGTTVHSQPLMMLPQLGGATYQDILIPEKPTTAGGGRKTKVVKKKVRKKVKKKGPQRD